MHIININLDLHTFVLSTITFLMQLALERMGNSFFKSVTKLFLIFHFQNNALK